MSTQDWSPLGWTGWISLQSKGLSRVFSNTTVQKHQFLGTQLSLWSNAHIHTWLLENHSFFYSMRRQKVMTLVRLLRIRKSLCSTRQNYWQREVVNTFWRLERWKWLQFTFGDFLTYIFSKTRKIEQKIEVDITRKEKPSSITGQLDSSICYHLKISALGWEVGGRFKREGTYVHLWLIHVDVWQKPTQYCKAIIL